MRILALVITSIILVGCATPKFAVEQVDTRFSENKNPLFLAKNNRISTKSIAGGIHIDEKGVYLNPFVEKDDRTDNVTLLGLNIINKTDYTTTYGGANQLGIIKEIVFRLSDGDLITLDVTNQDNKSSDTISYNTVAQYASYEKWETGVAAISKKELADIAFADRLSCRISGSRQVAIYEEEDIAPQFLVNLREFYNTYVE